MSWLNRVELAKHKIKDAKNTLLFANEPGEEFLPLNAKDIEAGQSISQVTLNKLGITDKSRVLMALNQNGSGATTLLAQATARIANQVALTSPNARMRLLASIKSMRPNVLFITPCGAMDLLARIYIEFNVDPEELGIEHIVLVGEIPSAGAAQRLATEFYAQVSHLYCDPYFGVALASNKGDGWEEGESGILRSASLTEDEEYDCPVTSPSNNISEIVFSPQWASSLQNTTLRTGQIVKPATDSDAIFQHTAGEHILIRGRWFSIPKLRNNLRTIDGIAKWTLEIERGEGTLDSATITIGLNRPSLVENPMWKGRLKDVIAAASAVTINLETQLCEEDQATEKEFIIDHRGHHLGTERKDIMQSEAIV